MLYRARRAIAYAMMNRACRGILSTPPLRPTADGPLILSMVSGQDFLLYLIAAKSWFGSVRRGRFQVIDDGTLSASQRDTLRDHLGATVVPIDDIPTGPTPRGGAWERLLRIADLVRENYVVQLDSDTLTVGPIDDVVRAIAAEASFTLVTHPNTTYCSIAEACAAARADPATDIHTIAEQVLDVAADPVSGRYVHGCAAFAGFARGSFTREDVYRFSEAMERTVGRRWWEWGSEQVTSNFIVSNAPRVAVIPYPKYRNFEGETLEADTAFIHFLGTYRFRRGYYAARARQVIATLRAEN